MGEGGGGRDACLIFWPRRGTFVRGRALIRAWVLIQGNAVHVFFLYCSAISGIFQECGIQSISSGYVHPYFPGDFTVKNVSRESNLQILFLRIDKCSRRHRV